MNLHQPEQLAPRQRRTLHVLQGCSMRVKIWRCLPFGPKRKAKNRLSPVYYVLALGRIALGRYQEEVQVVLHTLFQLSSFGILRIMIQKLFSRSGKSKHMASYFFIRTRIGEKTITQQDSLSRPPQDMLLGTIQRKELHSQMGRWRCQ